MELNNPSGVYVPLKINLSIQPLQMSQILEFKKKNIWCWYAVKQNHTNMTKEITEVIFMRINVFGEGFTFDETLTEI